MATEKTYRNEKDVKKEVRRLLEKHGYHWWMPPANGFGKVGVSDFHAIKPGPVFLAIETKFGDNKPTPHQKAFLETIMSCQAFGFVVSEKTLWALQTFLECFDRSASNIMEHAREKGDIAAVGLEDGASLLEAIRILTEPVVSARTIPEMTEKAAKLAKVINR